MNNEKIMEYILKADIKKQSILPRFNEATNRVYGVIGVLESKGITTEADRKEFTKVVDMLSDKIRQSEKQRELSTATEFL